MKYILLTEKKWHDSLFKNLTDRPNEVWNRISNKTNFNVDSIRNFSPDRIFIPHWSYIIPEEIFKNYECIVFHMTDLPFGRGGSPLQNLIIRGYEETMISALRVDQGLDTGDIYLKKPLSLLGSAEEIFMRASKIIEKMIGIIIDKNPLPEPQEGEKVFFKRRKPEDGNISSLQSLEEVFNYIRMLDCEGYPKAHLTVGDFHFDFSRASLKADNSIVANVRITKK